MVHLDLPKNVLVNKYHCRENLDKTVVELSNEDSVEDSKIIKVANAINRSANPIFFLGKGCSPNIDKLIEKTQIPFTTTIHSKGIITEEHPLSMEWCGNDGSAAANFALQKADCIIGVGARFDDRTTGLLDKYAPNAKNIINVNIDSQSFGKTVNSNHNIVMDSSDFINKIYPLLDNYIPTKEWINEINNLKKKNPFKYNIPEGGKLNTPMAISMLNKLTLGKPN